MEAVLADREWLAMTFCVADILMADGLRLVDRFVGLVMYAACWGYVPRPTSRPSFVKAHADQMAHFAAAERARSQTDADDEANEVAINQNTWTKVG